MPLSRDLKYKAENEVRLWAAEVGMQLELTGRMTDQTRTITAETLFRRMQQKYPDEMAEYSLDDLKESVFEDGDYFSNNWFTNNAPVGVPTIADDGRLRDEEWRRLHNDLPPLGSGDQDDGDQDDGDQDDGDQEHPPYDYPDEYPNDEQSD